MEVETKHVNIENIDSPGVIDKFNGKSSAKDMRGWIDGRLSIATRNNNLEVQKLLEIIKKAYNHYHPKEHIEVEASQWKGKSSFEIIKRVSGLTIIKYQKLDKLSEPKKIVTEVDSEELHSLIESILWFNNVECIETKDIARRFSYHIKQFQPDYFSKSVYRDGRFDWDSFFSNRIAHNKLTLMLNALDKLGFIEYSGGKTKIINKALSIQSIFK